jgi:hypothetical protein
MALLNLQNMRMNKIFIHLPLTLGLASAALTSCTSLNTEFTALSYAPTTQPQLISAPPQVNLEHYQSVETNVGRPWQRSDIALAVTASGGGYRAANLTAGVLIGLEKFTHPALKGRLLDEVDYFSTVSGGGIGVGSYIATLHHYLENHPNVQDLRGFSFKEALFNDKPRPSLNMPYNSLLLKIAVFSSWYKYVNQGQYLEDALENNVLNYNHQPNSLTLGDIFVPATASESLVRMPYWVANATIFQNGAIFPFTPDVLMQYRVINYRFKHALTRLRGPFDAMNYAYDFPLAISMRTSANYPIALPPTILTSTGCTNLCYLHLIDGGLADNLGLTTALNLLSQDKAPIKMLIVIDAYRGEVQPFSINSHIPSNLSALWRVLNLVTDSTRNRTRAALHQAVFRKLCIDGAKKVFTLYLDIDEFPGARNVSTSFDITAVEQNMMLYIGQRLVQMHSQEIKTFLDSLDSPANSKYHCVPVPLANNLEESNDVEPLTRLAAAETDSVLR